MSQIPSNPARTAPASNGRVAPEAGLIRQRATPSMDEVQAAAAARARRVAQSPDLEEELQDDEFIESEPQDGEGDEPIATEGDEPQGQGADPEVDPEGLNDDELLDALLAQDEQPARAEGQKPKADAGSGLEGAYQTEYDAAVEKYGQDMADSLVKPLLLREQARDRQIAPLLAHFKAQEEAQQRHAEEQVYSFFGSKSQSGFASIYGADPRKSNQFQQQAQARVVQVAAQIKQKAQAAGINLPPAKALEKAHQKLWGGTAIGQRVTKSQATMEKRATNTVVPARASGSKAPGAPVQDRYANVRKAIEKSGWNNRNR